MNSRERILAASERRRTDRPPCGLRCTPEGWEALRNYLGVQTSNEVLDELDIDLRWVGVPFIGPEERSAVFLESVGTDFLGQNGGYIVAPTHMIQGDTPPENVVAIFRAVQDYRWN